MTGNRSTPQILLFTAKLTAILFFSLAVAFGIFWLLSPKTNALFQNSDFENGDLTNWQSDGEAFSRQPTLGDNPLKRGRTEPTQFQGNYWVGTYENRPNADSPEGAIQGDPIIGRLTSTSFIIQKSKLSFLAGAGTGTADTSVSLVVNGQTVLTHVPNATLLNAETLTPVVWDVAPWIKQKAHIVIVDQATGAWGHINVDDFHYS